MIFRFFYRILIFFIDVINTFFVELPVVVRMCQETEFLIILILH